MIGNDLPPVPHPAASSAVSWAIGPQDMVLKGKYQHGPSRDQGECLDIADEGDVLVGFDPQGRVSTMHMLVGKRFVAMQDGFETSHVQILMQNLGAAGKFRTGAADIARGLATLPADIEAMGTEDRQKLHDLIEMAEHLVRPEEAAAPEMTSF